MLINTVILFLRDALPIFVLVSYLYAYLPANKLWLWLALMAGALLSLIYITQFQVISQWFDGKGIELSVWLSQLLLYLLALVLAYGLGRNWGLNRLTITWVAGFMVSLTLMSKGSNFIVYFEGFWRQSDVLQSMLLGTFLGLGICLSLSVLLYLAAQWLQARFGPWAIWLLIFIFVTGQLVSAIPLLVQVDIIDATSIAWNTQHLLSNELEFGHLFKVLFGYQASPSYTQVVVYVLALMLPLTIFYWLNRHSASHSGNSQ